MRKLFAAAFIGLTLCLVAPAQAGWDEGVAAFYRGDYATALREFRPLADQGNTFAQFLLGNMYYNGQDVTQDYAEAVKWYRKAAGQGYASAQYNLGVMYYNGQGVTQDYVQAHMWYNLAVSKGHENATKNRDNVAEKMTPAQIAEAQRLAREWRPRHHAQGGHSRPRPARPGADQQIRREIPAVP